MKISTFVYTQYLGSRGLSKKFWSFIRVILIKFFNDPTCTMLVHGKYLDMPLSHVSPYYLNKFPFYDRLPSRISNYIFKKYGNISCIDVGANIGDTISAFHVSGTDRFLAIEPSPKYCKYLSANWNSSENVIIVSEMCSSVNGNNTVIIQEERGTASIHKSKNGNKIKMSTLDNIVIHNFAENSVNIVKIDTDGYDFDVIEGADKLLRENFPVLLFECDVFGNKEYTENCLKTLQYLKNIGYGDILIYDNFGSLMGKYSLSDLIPIRNLLFYQLTSSFHYFDFLVMKDEDLTQFYKTEIEFFIYSMQDQSLKKTTDNIMNY